MNRLDVGYRWFKIVYTNKKGDDVMIKDFKRYKLETEYVDGKWVTGWKRVK